MSHEHATARYRKLYAKLLHLYPKPYRERFAEGMEQTFNDLCRERTGAGKGLFTFALWTFGETFIGILRENVTSFTHVLKDYKNLRMPYKKILRVALVTAVLLLVPLVAMLITDEMAWGLADFVIAGGLLFGTGLAFDLVASRSRPIAYRFAIGIALAAALLLVWVNLAVGLIGNENNPFNQMYFGVLAIGIIGAVLARFRPHGMARALFVTAFAQALVPVIALMIGRPPIATLGQFIGVVGVFVLNSFFVVLFVGSAMLFRKAALKQPPAVAVSES